MTDLEARLAAFSPEKLALLEQRLRTGQRGPATSSEPIKPGRRGGPLPLSFAQQRMWFLDRLQPGSPLYNVPAAIRLGGVVDVPLLERTLTEVVRRHESLRTSFPSEQGTVVQFISAASPVQLAVADLRALSPAAREEEAMRLMARAAQLGFDLQRGPLFRVSLIRLADADHVLLLTLHHTITDAWSMRLLLREIATIYEAFRAGSVSPLPEPPIQYADFALWQREQLTGEPLAALLGYWKRELAGAPTVLDLPTDRPRPRAQTYRGAAHSFVLEPEVTARLKALSRSRGATLFMTMLAAFATLLHRLCGRDDITIGSPIAHRSRVELESLIGLVTNTIVLRCRFDGQPNFEELLERVKQVTLGAYAHQDLPFEKLVEELQPERSLSHNPLFQVLFTLQVANEGQAGPSGDEFLSNEMAKFDLSLFVVDLGSTLSAAFEYNTDLFEAVTVERMAGHFRTLVASIAGEPHRAVSRLQLLTSAELQDLTAGGNRTAAAHSAESVVELFARQAARTPHAIATKWNDAALTYAELDARSNDLARMLRSRGIGAESLVGLALERSADVAVGVLGVLKSGAAYLPLDPDYPRLRLSYLITEAKPALVLAHRSLVERLPLEGVPVLCLDEELQAGDGGESGVITGESLAYVLYTSGSTGQPKGVAMTHRALANLISWQLGRQSGPQTTLQYASLSFDVSFQEIFATLCSGGTLVFVPEAVRREPTELARFIERHAIERLFLPFVALHQLAYAATRLIRVLPLTDIVTAGEKLHITGRVAQLFVAMPRCTLYNQYGPTETHVVCEHVLTGPAAQWPAEPPIGRPIVNAELYVLDHLLQPVPVGVEGELYVGGEALARGYLNRPELTAERFVPNPFSAAPGGRLYRTGDVVRRLADGSLQFVGRRDAQVKVRGYRIEVAEVEAALREHGGVTEAAAVVQENGGQRRLAGFFTGTAEPAEVQGFLRARLPEFMVPSSLVALATLPLTPSGKVDRLALAASAMVQSEQWVAPRTPTEHALAAIWSDVLGIDGVGIDDNFFETGGHSLHAAQVVARIREELQVEVPLQTLFESPTIRDLAAAVSAAAASGSSPGIGPIAPVETELLARIDELPDSEVDALLRSLLESETHPTAPIARQAEKPVPRVDELGDAEVHRLLAELLASRTEGEGGGSDED